MFHKLTRHVIQDTEGKKVSDLIGPIIIIVQAYILVLKIRFCVFHIEYSSTCKRKYDSQNREIEPNFGQTKLVNTGYLNSSYSEFYNTVH